MLQTEGLSRQAVSEEEAMHRAASLQHLAIDLERLLDSGKSIGTIVSERSGAPRRWWPRI